MPAHSASMLRIACDGNAAGAIVTVNGRKMGECPLDMQVQPGDVRIQATKPRDPETNLVFEQSLYLGDGVVKRIEVLLEKTALTAEGVRRQKERERERLRQEAELRRQEELRRQQQEEAKRQRSLQLEVALNKLRAQGAEPGNGKSFKDCDDCPSMVLLSSPGRDPVAMGQFEISRAQYAQFATETKRPTGKGCTVWNGGWFTNISEFWKVREDLDWTNPGHEQKDDHPVVCVSVRDALAFIEWLSVKTGQRYQLPSFAWWSVAAGGEYGKEVPVPWTGTMAAACRYGNLFDRSGDAVATATRSIGTAYDCDDGAPYTAAIGGFAASPYGVFDLWGNVTEMLEDLDEDTQRFFSQHPRFGRQKVHLRQLRGFSFFSVGRPVTGWLVEEDNLTDFRDSIRHHAVGFRVMRLLIPKEPAN